MDSNRHIVLEYPKHIAIIMDGNGRWAQAKGLEISEGHREGGAAVQRCIKAALDYHIPYLTLYAFSAENWRRSEKEVEHLTSLLKFYLRSKINDLDKRGVSLRIIGDPKRFGSSLVNELKEAEERTKHNNNLILLLALSYGGRAELTDAFKKILTQVENGEICISDINEHYISQQLQTHNVPDPDIIVRTSGEHRLSNFLLWQSAYSELFFMDVLWPDFSKKDFHEILSSFSKRNRRFGGRPL